jgi:glycosyltransferase involved in cell wall biosynthesis
VLGSEVRQHHDLRFLNLYRADDRRGGRLNRANVLRTFADARAVRQASRAADIVHIHTALLPLVTMLRAGLMARAARRSGARVVLQVHSGLIESWLTSSGRKALTRRVLAPVDRVITVTEGGRRSLEAVLGSRRVVLIDNGVEVAAFGPQPEPHDPPRILYVGVLSPRKGVVDLLRASARLTERGVAHEVWLAGGTPEEGAGPEAEVRAAAGGSVRFLGVRPHDAIPQLYRQADVFCLPSWYEGMPLSILEAMASGLPVVASDVGDVARAITDGVTGHLVRAHDVEQLIAMLEPLLLQPGVRRRMGRAGRQQVEDRFDVATTCARLDALYAEMRP